jgi:hypothetical protein
MIPNDVLTQLQSLIRTSAPPLLEVSEHPTEMPQWVPGQKLTATVLATLPNGRFQVLVSDMFLDMNLPKNTQPGQNIELTFISGQPRLTFALSKDLELAAQSQPNVKLSDTARFLGGLLEKLSTMKSEESAPMAKMAPLIAGEPVNTKELAQVLHGAISKSGLFYESHQAQWVAGQRPLSELLQEPQGRLSTGPMISKEAGGQMVHLGHNTQDNPKVPVGNENLQHLATKPGGTMEEKVHPQTFPLVQQQIETLDTRQMVWQGQIWPQQSMRWEIEERAARESEGEEFPVWQTRLRLQMPNLGDVTAILAFAPQGIKIDIDVAEDTTGILMRASQPELGQAFDRAGLKLTGMVVHAKRQPD